MSAPPIYIFSNSLQSTQVLIKDMGILIPPSGGSEVLTTDAQLESALESSYLRTLCLDDVHAPSGSTLKLSPDNGSTFVDATSAAIEQFLDTRRIFEAYKAEDLITDFPDGYYPVSASGHMGLQPVPSGTTPFGESWTFDVATADADPGSGKFRFNQLVQADATFIYLSDLTSSGLDLEKLLLRLRVNDYLFIQQRNVVTRALVLKITGTPTDAVGYVKIPVTASDVVSEIQDAQSCGLIFHLGAVLSDGTPVNVGGGSSSPGTSEEAPRLDHVHGHGNQTATSLHALADYQNAGFLDGDSRHWANHGFDTAWSYNGDLSYATGLTVSCTAGEGFINDATQSNVKPYVVYWIADTVSLTASALNYIYVTGTNTVVASTTAPDLRTVIMLGVAWTDATQVTLLAHARPSLLQLRSDFYNYCSEVFGGAATQGLIGSENAITPFRLDITAGVYFIGGGRRTSGNNAPITFTYWRKDGAGGAWISTPGQTTFGNTQYDKDGVLTALTTDWFKKSLVLVTENGDGDEYHVVEAQDEHFLRESAENGNLPELPDVLTRYTARFAGVVVQEGAAAITTVTDEKPLLGQRSDEAAADSVVRSLAFPLIANGSPEIYGEHVVQTISTNGEENFEFQMPFDLLSVIRIDLVGVPSAGAAQSGRDIDLSSEYGNFATGESPAQHAETDTTSTYDLSGKSGLLTSIPLESVFTQAEANDQCGINIDHNSIGGSIYYFTILLTYLAEA